MSRKNKLFKSTKIVKLNVLLTIFISSIMNINNIFADSFSEFSVKAIIPDNQINTQLSYFDLRMSPIQEQTIQIQITNNSDEVMNANIQLNPATTERNGVILYTHSDNMDQSMSIPITDIATVVQSEISVPAKESIYADIILKMPNDSFDGIILGGIAVTATSANETQTEIKEVQVQNQYAYTVGLKISETDNKVDPDFYLKSIEPGNVNYKTSLLINLQNNQPEIVKGMIITGQVYKKNSNDVLRELSLDNVDVAPNSNFDVVVDWEDQKIEAGTYRLKLRAEYQGKVWEWDEEFTISSNIANNVNSEAININKGLNMSQITIFILIIIILFLIFILFFRRKRRKD